MVNYELNDETKENISSCVGKTYDEIVNMPPEDEKEMIENTVKFSEEPNYENKNITHKLLLINIAITALICIILTIFENFIHESGLGGPIVVICGTLCIALFAAYMICKKLEEKK